ncbi:MAG: SRPBCC family protein [Bacteroidales bacterium]|jgi:hypothetical protein|nr:SRPBCC family protein [Bacteroidales bacterium]MDI9545911.1 SRPBCC family protein [Bacteroidota bacterium]OQC02699.1 MAG: hypothetical protein BWX77_01062 [Bacteroidetes bacterium ADurb.Bin090]NLV39126.1 SRPBCC family protein [Bacteroidales bacterium]HOD26776.1 SRPBCC family protein [Bacteroidales bacterium]
MTEFKTQTGRIAAPACRVFEVLSDWNQLEKIKEKIPESKLRGLEFDADSCRFVIDSYGVGEIALCISERNPCSAIKIKAEQSPIDFNAVISIEEENPEACLLTIGLEAALPFMLKHILSPSIQTGLDKILNLLTEYSY